MSAVPVRAGWLPQLWRDPRHVSLAVTVALFVAMSVAGGVLYEASCRRRCS